MADNEEFMLKHINAEKQTIRRKNIHSHSSDIKKDIAYNLDRLIKSLIKSKKECVLGATQKAILCLLSNKNQALQIKKIKEILGISSDNLSHALRLLENYKGKECLIKRKGDNKDIRCKALQITEKGEDILAEIYRSEEKRFKPIFETLNYEDLNMFLELLKKIIPNLKI